MTRDHDFLDDGKFPNHNLKDSAIVVFRTKLSAQSTPNFNYALAALLSEIVKSGRSNLAGLKMEVRGPRIIPHARIDGKVRHDEVDISSPIIDRNLFDHSE